MNAKASASLEEQIEAALEHACALFTIACNAWLFDQEALRDFEFSCAEIV